MSLKFLTIVLKVYRPKAINCETDNRGGHCNVVRRYVYISHMRNTKKGDSYHRIKSIVSARSASVYVGIVASAMRKPYTVRPSQMKA